VAPDGLGKDTLETGGLQEGNFAQFVNGSRQGPVAAAEKSSEVKVCKKEVFELFFFSLKIDSLYYVIF